ncbi:site-specific integrase [Brevundimonas naejangsanensis]|uniref:Site-specific integrase n=1 Tax=Brevundimonas naejangsanensis TaxID=588932 RepID=A0A494RP24_9CAUL|nr:site-specific integrase [Brevundimonas naejangsanensis]AYG95792.1 site-specific integrase [Brevundimonas naejangsanensis]
MPKVRLTDKFVASVSAPPGKRLDVHDENPRGAGLMLRVSETGRKAWTFRYRTENGDKRRLSLGLYPDVSLVEARKRCAQARLQAIDGVDPAGEKRRKRVERQSQTIKTFRDLSVAYFDATDRGEWKPRGKRKRPSTIAAEKWLWTKHIEPALGSLRLEDVTPAAIKELLRKLLAKGQDTSSNRVRAQIRQMFNYAILEAEAAAFNPVSRVPAQGSEVPRDRVLKDEEIRSIWAALDDPESLVSATGTRRANQRVYVSRPVGLAIKLLLLTLQRRHEIAGMMRTEVDLDQAVWSIPGSRTKNGRPTLVPLSPSAVELIREAISLADAGHATPSRFVFPARWDRDKSLSPASLTRSLRDVRSALALPCLTPHDLRRTAATMMASERLRISPFVIGRLLNHTSEKGGAASVTLSTYALYDFMSEKRAALAAWDRLLGSILTAHAERAHPSERKHQISN